MSHCPLVWFAYQGFSVNIFTCWIWFRDKIRYSHSYISRLTYFLGNCESIDMQHKLGFRLFVVPFGSTNLETAFRNILIGPNFEVFLVFKYSGTLNNPSGVSLFDFRVLKIYYNKKI